METYIQEAVQIERETQESIIREETAILRWLEQIEQQHQHEE